jgi:hypothetical protein
MRPSRFHACIHSLNMYKQFYHRTSRGNGCHLNSEVWRIRFMSRSGGRSGILCRPQVKAGSVLKLDSPSSFNILIYSDNFRFCRWRKVSKRLTSFSLFCSALLQQSRKPDSSQERLHPNLWLKGSKTGYYLLFFISWNFSGRTQQRENILKYMILKLGNCVYIYIYIYIHTHTHVTIYTYFRHLHVTSPSYGKELRKPLKEEIWI